MLSYAVQSKSLPRRVLEMMPITLSLFILEFKMPLGIAEGLTAAEDTQEYKFFSRKAPSMDVNPASPSGRCNSSHQSIAVNTKTWNTWCVWLLWHLLCFYPVFKYSEIDVVLPFDMWASTIVNFSQRKTAGAVVFRRMCAWDCQQVMTPPSLLHLQPCFGRCQSSGEMAWFRICFPNTSTSKQ